MFYLCLLLRCDGVVLGFVCPNQLELEIRTDGGPRKIDQDKVG
ncbi:hypothetical protein HanPI659440_Chr10g0361811 [Helianthus annuus]|nr:hypothetical protein HanPI659440_Chr10g0361811 [Helianthus annuus]